MPPDLSDRFKKPFTPSSGTAADGEDAWRAGARRRQAGRLPATFACVMGLVLLAWLLTHPGSVPGARLARTSYDLTLALRGPAGLDPLSSPVVIVYLDRKSYQEEGQDPARLLDRRLYARLLRRLATVHSSWVIFDILFDQPSEDPGADAEFADALRAHGRVLLGAEWHRADEVRGSDARLAVRSVSLPTSNLLAAAAGYGFAFSRIDPDFVVRRHFPGFVDRGLPSLSWAAAERLRLPVTRLKASASTPRWLNYYGPPLTVPGVSLSDALDPEIVRDAMFRGRIVLVGTRPTAGRFDERRDEWRSPLSGWGRGVLFMPAVEVHATELLNLVQGDWLRRPDAAVEFSWMALAAGALAWGFLRLRPVSVAIAAIALEALVLGMVGVLVISWHLWFAWLIPAGVLIPAAVLESFLFHSVDWYRQRVRYLARIRDQAELIDKARDAIVVLDFSGSVVHANPRARQLYGWTTGRPGREGIHSAFGGDPGGMELDEILHEARRSGGWSGELQNIGADGRPMVMECRATLIRNNRGTPHEVLFINTDVTERKRLQEQFLRAQRMETIGTLAGGMAHDLNNALSPILMGIQLLRSRLSDQEVRRMLEVMETNTQRGAGMVRQVLLFARGHDDTRIPTAMGPLLREMENLLHHTFPAAVTLSVLVPADLWRVRANPTQLHQVLLNLCVNARDAMPDGGSLTLAADNAELDAGEAGQVPGLQAGRHVVVLVSDTGSGIPPGIQERIFEPFFTTKPAGKGTGLGLATVAAIVRAHGGGVRVKSQPGEGTTFEFFLPALPEAMTAEPLAPIPTEAPRGSGELVLVVDDELSVRDLLRVALTENGYEVVTASHAVEAMAVARQKGEALRLVITDWRMPGLDGGGLAAELRRLRANLPIIVVSGALNAVTGGAGLPTPPVTVLPKPFRIETLLQRLQDMLK